MHRDPNKIIIPASDKYKQQPVHIRGAVVCRSYAVIPDPGFTNIVKSPVSEHVVVTTGRKTVYPTLGAMFTQGSEVGIKKQLTTDQITALGLKRITIESILEEYKYSCNVEQITQYIIGLHVYRSLSADQQDLLCDKVVQIMSENGLDYYYKTPSAELCILATSEPENNSIVTIDEFRSTVLASADKTAWVSLDSVVQIVGDHALGNSVLARKMAANKDLKGHNLLIVDSGIATDETTVIVRVTDISDTISSIATIENIKNSLIEAGGKKALWFNYNETAQGLGINLNVLSTAEADKVIKQYLQRNGVFVVYKGTLSEGESAIRLGFTKPVKAKQN